MMAAFFFFDCEHGIKLYSESHCPTTTFFPSSRALESDAGNHR
jgi:hypothetical protein